MASVIPSAPLGTDAAAGRPQGLGAAAGAGPYEAAAERRFRFELAAHPGSPAQARRLTRARLTGWSVCEDTCDTAALVISELVTNAIVHTASGVVVCELSDGDDLVRIAVRDQGCAPGEPHPSPQRPEEEHGRGLFLVDALCRAWGAQEHGTGLLVWADLARGADEAGAEVEPARGAAETAAEGGTATAAAAREPGDGDTGTDGTDFARLADRSHPGLAHALTRPRNDLGWGAPPKPGPADGSGDDNDAPTESDNGATPQDTTGATAPQDTTASSDATADTAPAGRHGTRDERIRERGERGGDHPDPSGHGPETDAKSGPASDPGDARPGRAAEDRTVDHGQVHSPAHGNRAVTPTRRPHHTPGSEPRASSGDTRPATGPLNRLPHLPGHAHPADGPLPRVSQQWQRAGAGPGASVPGRSADPAGDAATKPTGPQSKRSAPLAQPAPTTSAAPAPASWNSAARDRGTG
ncbi:ATP-binding protein [Streptomyces sp. NPDC086091]|uniref:ATP-binding protein n=1 Tax=Streptomyces sp. NPDC086091 TaxID=3365751 RepID=UPI0037F9FB3F